MHTNNTRMTKRKSSTSGFANKQTNKLTNYSADENKTSLTEVIEDKSSTMKR